MIMLEDCIEKIFEQSNLDSDNKELYRSIYYHLSDYKDILNGVIELNNEIDKVAERWALVSKTHQE